MQPQSPNGYDDGGRGYNGHYGDGRNGQQEGLGSPPPVPTSAAMQQLNELVERADAKKKAAAYDGNSNGYGQSPQRQQRRQNPFYAEEMTAERAKAVIRIAERRRANSPSSSANGSPRALEVTADFGLPRQLVTRAPPQLQPPSPAQQRHPPRRVDEVEDYVSERRGQSGNSRRISDRFRQPIYRG